jgi:polyisoprenoid-binding protein YceI
MMFVVMLAACSPADPAPVENAILEQVQEATPAQETPQTEKESDLASEPEEPAAVEGMLVFLIVNEGTEARFMIDEVLRGEPKTVVGATDKVTGEIRVDLAGLSATEVGVITIEAGALKTDNNFRNGAIENFILQTGSFPLITFSPTSIEGLPAEVAVGDSLTFNLSGDLTIREITQLVTFSVNVTVPSETEIQGSAVTTVLRGDFGLTIPSVPQVASVSEEVFLELDFTATR